MASIAEQEIGKLIRQSHPRLVKLQSFEREMMMFYENNVETLIDKYIDIPITDTDIKRRIRDRARYNCSSWVEYIVSVFSDAIFTGNKIKRDWGELGGNAILLGFLRDATRRNESWSKFVRDELFVRNLVLGFSDTLVSNPEDFVSEAARIKSRLFPFVRTIKTFEAWNWEMGHGGHFIYYISKSRILDDTRRYIDRYTVWMPDEIQFWDARSIGGIPSRPTRVIENELGQVPIYRSFYLRSNADDSIGVSFFNRIMGDIINEWQVTVDINAIAHNFAYPQKELAIEQIKVMSEDLKTGTDSKGRINQSAFNVIPNVPDAKGQRLGAKWLDMPTNSIEMLIDMKYVRIPARIFSMANIAQKDMGITQSGLALEIVKELELEQKRSFANMMQDDENAILRLFGQVSGIVDGDINRFVPVSYRTDFNVNTAKEVLEELRTVVNNKMLPADVVREMTRSYLLMKWNELTPEISEAIENWNPYIGFGDLVDSLKVNDGLTDELRADFQRLLMELSNNKAE